MKTTHPESDWQVPRRQSPAAIVIMLLQTAVSLLKAFWPLIIIYFIRKDDDKGLPLIWLVIGFSVIAIFAAFIKYLFYSFYISNESLVIKSGWIKKKTLTVPLKNIQGVHIKQNPWQQILKVAAVSLDSTGSEKVEVKIDALKLVHAEQLKQQLLGSESIDLDETKLIPARSNFIFQLSIPDLLKLSLTANHLEAFFILFGISINLIDDIQDIFNIDGWKMMGDYAGKVASGSVAITMLIIFVALVSILVSMFRTILKYYDFKLEETQSGWKAYFGLITSQQILIPIKKIQILSWKANWLRRKINFWIVQVQTIGHEEISHKQHVHIPVTQKEMAIQLSSYYQLTEVISTGEGLKISDQYWKRKTFFRALPTTFILAGILSYFLSEYAWLILCIVPAAALHHYKWQQNFRWQANDEGIQLYSGVWGRKYSLLTWKKIQQVEIKQSIYQQRAGLTSLVFKTAGGNLMLHYIHYETGLQICNKILYLVESRTPDWM